MSDAQLAELPAETATPVVIRSGTSVCLTVAVAEPGPLIAMKPHSIMTRGAAKEATDLLDIIRLMLDTTSGPVARDQLGQTERLPRHDAARHAGRWFGSHADRSLRPIHAAPKAAIWPRRRRPRRGTVARR